MISNPFLRPDDRRYEEILTDAAVHVLETTGVDRFSVAAMARWMKVSPEAIHNNYSRARVLELVAICFSNRWLRWSVGDPLWLRAEHPCPLRLPRSVDERHGVRVLHALTELARGERVMGNPVPGTHLARLRQDEATLLRSRLAQLAPDPLSGPVDDVGLRGLTALLSGLRSSLTEEPCLITWEQACELAARAATALASPGRAAQTTRSDLHRPSEPAA